MRGGCGLSSQSWDSGACSDQPWAGASAVGRRVTARSTPAETKDCVTMMQLQYKK